MHPPPARTIVVPAAPRRAVAALRLHRAGASVAALWLAMAPAHAAERALLTLLDGEATVVDGSARSAAALGQALAPAALVETGSGSAFVRIELPDQTAIDLGPATKAMVGPPGLPARGGQAPVLYLLQGWAKVTAPEKKAAGGVVTPALELMPFQGVAVLQIERAQRHVFAESGTLDLAERPGGKRLNAAPGSFYTAGEGVQPRAAPAWLATVPRPFRDRLPLRAAALKDRGVTPPPLPAPGYAALADWLSAEPAIRRPFPQRFAALARDPAFRQQLQAHLPSHPEWGTVLNPPSPKGEVPR